MSTCVCLFWQGHTLRSSGAFCHCVCPPGLPCYVEAVPDDVYGKYDFVRSVLSIRFRHFWKGTCRLNGGLFPGRGLGGGAETGNPEDETARPSERRRKPQPHAFMRKLATRGVGEIDASHGRFRRLFARPPPPAACRSARARA